MRPPGHMMLPRGLWSALSEVEDAVLREDLALLAVSIQVYFRGRAAREASVVELMAERFAWAGSRTRRRLDSLVDLGVLHLSRDLADHWTKVFEIIDRPHVPADLALEMGA